MKKIMKNVIAAGGYKLADMQYKIKKLYAMGDLTEAEADELLSLAAGCVSVDAERPEVLEMLSALSGKVAALEERMNLLEGRHEEGVIMGYPAWQSWDGINDCYQPDTIVTHNGKIWISTFQGQNVWEPGVVDGTFWTEYILEHDSLKI